MKRKRYTHYKKEQIMQFLKLADEGVPVSEICSKNDISHSTFYQWRSKLKKKAVNEKNGGLSELEQSYFARIDALEDMLRKLQSENTCLRNAIIEMFLNVQRK